MVLPVIRAKSHAHVKRVASLTCSSWWNQGDEPHIPGLPSLVAGLWGVNAYHITPRTCKRDPGSANSQGGSVPEGLPGATIGPNQLGNDEVGSRLLTLRFTCQDNDRSGSLGTRARPTR